MASAMRLLVSSTVKSSAAFPMMGVSIDSYRLQGAKSSVASMISCMVMLPRIHSNMVSKSVDKAILSAK